MIGKMELLMVGYVVAAISIAALLAYYRERRIKDSKRKFEDSRIELYQLISRYDQLLPKKKYKFDFDFTSYNHLNIDYVIKAGESPAVLYISDRSGTSGVEEIAKWVGRVRPLHLSMSGFDQCAIEELCRSPTTQEMRVAFNKGYLDKPETKDDWFQQYEYGQAYSH